MNKGDIVKFSDLQIGDYFCADEQQKCRKILPFEFSLPDVSPVTFNAFHIQSHASISLPPDAEIIFIKHSPWIEEEKYGFRLTIEESELEHQLEFLKNYLTTLEGFLSTSYAEAEPIPLDESFSKQEIDEFTSLLFSSFVVSLFSYLETRMVNECRKSQQEDSEIRKSIDKLPGNNNIHKAKKYLVEELDTSFPFDNDPVWKEIDYYNKIRNCIVHKEGRVVDKEMKKYLEGRNDISLEKAFGNDYLILTKNFCEKMLSDVVSFLTSFLHYRQADKIT